MPEITQKSAPSATTSPTTARIRAVGNPGRFATIPCASRRRANQSSRPSSPRGGSKPPPPGPPVPPVVSNSPIVPSNLTRRIRSRRGARDGGYVGGRRPASRPSPRRSSGPRACARRGRRATARTGEPLRARVAHEAASWRSPRSSPSRRARSSSTSRSAGIWRHTRRARGPRSRPRHLLSHASGLPESGPAGVPPLEVELARPPATRRVYSNEGYAVLGELIAAATGIPHPDYVRQAVFEPLGMDAYLGLPEHEDGRALTVLEPGRLAARASSSSTRASGAAGRPPRAERSRRSRPTRASSRCSCPTARR